MMFNMSQISTKLYLSIITLVVFYILFLTVPDHEFSGYDGNVIDSFHKLHFTIRNHTGLGLGNTLNPISRRSKVLSILHGLMSFLIFIS